MNIERINELEEFAKTFNQKLEQAYTSYEEQVNKLITIGTKSIDDVSVVTKVSEYQKENKNCNQCNYVITDGKHFFRAAQLEAEQFLRGIF